MNAVHQSIQPDTASGLLAVIGSAFVGVGAVQTAGSHLNVWSDPWFDAGCAALAAATLLAVWAIILWWRSRPAANPLELDLVSEDWQLFADKAWAFGVEVRATNSTENQITFVSYRLLSRSDETQQPTLDREDQDAVDNWLAELTAKHPSQIFLGRNTVPPGESIARWFVNSASAPLPDGGRPAFLLRIKDTLNNAYELEIEARPAQTFRFKPKPQ
jgi:hypothetical protein